MSSDQVLLCAGIMLSGKGDTKEAYGMGLVL